MMDFVGLRRELDGDPVDMGYAAAADDQAIADLLNEPLRTVPRPLAVGALQQAVDNMADADGMPVWERIEALAGAATAVGVACRAAIRLRNAHPSYPPVDMQSTMLQAQVGVLVGEGILTLAQAQHLDALGSRQISRAAEIGLEFVLPRHIAKARIVENG